MKVAHNRYSLPRLIEPPTHLYSISFHLENGPYSHQAKAVLAVLYEAAENHLSLYALFEAISWSAISTILGIDCTNARLLAYPQAGILPLEHRTRRLQRRKDFCSEMRLRQQPARGPSHTIAMSSGSSTTHRAHKLTKMSSLQIPSAVSCTLYSRCLHHATQTPCSCPDHKSS